MNAVAAGKVNISPTTATLIIVVFIVGSVALAYRRWGWLGVVLTVIIEAFIFALIGHWHPYGVKIP